MLSEILDILVVYKLRNQKPAQQKQQSTKQICEDLRMLEWSRENKISIVFGHTYEIPKPLGWGQQPNDEYKGKTQRPCSLSFFSIWKI